MNNSMDWMCWICCKKIDDAILLPHIDEYCGQPISMFKNTFIIKDVEPFTFCYYTCCNYCIEDYLKIYNNRHHYLLAREIGKKFNYLKR